MTVEYIDGIKVMRLRDCNGQSGPGGSDRAMMALWQMLTGAHAMRDASIFSRRL